MATPTHCGPPAQLIGGSAGVSALVAAQVAILIMRSNEIKDFFVRQTDCDYNPTWCACDLCEWWAMLAPLVSPVPIIFGLVLDSYAFFWCYSSVSVFSHIGGTFAGLITGLADELYLKAKSGHWLRHRF